MPSEKATVGRINPLSLEGKGELLAYTHRGGMGGNSDRKVAKM